MSVRGADALQISLPWANCGFAPTSRRKVPKKSLTMCFSGVLTPWTPWSRGIFGRGAGTFRGPMGPAAGMPTGKGGACPSLKSSRSLDLP